MRAAICSRSAPCSTRCSRAAAPSTANRSRDRRRHPRARAAAVVDAATARTAGLDRIVATCLAKDPDERWQTRQRSPARAAWVRDAIGRPRARPRRRRRGRPPRVAIGAGLAAGGPWRSHRTLAADCRRYRAAASRSGSIAPPTGTRFPRGTVEMAISPDATRLVFRRASADGPEAVAAAIRCGRKPADRRKRGRAATVLVARWPLDCVLRQQQAEADRRSRRRATNDLRYREARDRGHMEPNGDDPVRRRVPAKVSAGERTPAVRPMPGERAQSPGQERPHAWPVFLPMGVRFLYLAQSDDRATHRLFRGRWTSTETRRVFGR